MLKKILIILLTLKTAMCLANIEDIIMKDIYSPLGNIRDLAFELHSKEIQNLVQEKIVTNDIKELKLKYFWNKNNFDVEILDSKKIGKITREIILNEYKNIIALVLGDSFNKFIQGYELNSSSGETFQWKDSSGLKDISEIKIKRKQEKIIIDQTKSNGKMITTMSFKTFPWSKPKMVLTRVDKNIYEGNQSIKITTAIEYFKKNGYFLPKVMNVKTQHILNQKSDGNYTRQIEVKYEFLNYHINTAEALRWFSTR